MDFTDLIFLAVFLIAWFVVVTKVLPRFGVRS